MWVADAAYGSRLNAAATDLVMTAYGIQPDDLRYGTVVLTGGTVDGADIHFAPWRLVAVYCQASGRPAGRYRHAQLVRSPQDPQPSG